MKRSPAYRALAPLDVGDLVPESLYVLDYSDGTRPRWRVVSFDRRRGGALVVVLEDVDNGREDLFAPGLLNVTVITSPRKTLRSPAYLVGSAWNTLCDLDQQIRHVAKDRAA